MTDDLITRLRSVRANMPISDIPSFFITCLDAAYEIERLRMELAEANACLEQARDAVGDRAARSGRSK